MKLTRRQLLGFSALVVANGGYAFAIEPQWMRLQEYTLTSSKWASAKSLKIAYASDFHVGCPSVGLEETAYIVEKLNALKPDIILLGGDFLISGILFGQKIPAAEIGEVLSKLHAPLGVYSVLGNHDWWEDGLGMWAALEKAGIRVLENSALKIKRDEGDFWIAGMADDTTRDPDYSKILATITDNNPVILLAHDPASFMEIDSRPVVTMCGHTHGGQVTVPYISPIVIPGRAPLKYAYGHIVEQGKDLIVSGGIGTSVLPVRFGRRPEIVSLTVTGEAE